MDKIPIYIPYLERYTKSALDSIRSNWISNYGKYIDLAGDQLKKLLNVKYCILMNNGTSATHCLYVALKLKCPNLTRIYIPNGVFIAPWNTGLMEYPKDVFEVMKTDPLTLNIDVSEEYIMTLEKNSAIVIVHNYGNIVNVPRLKRLRPDMTFVEDNCEGLFGKYEGMYSGTQSLCSSCSFYANKSITTGEGGCFFTNDDQIYEYMKTFYSHGMTSERYIHDRVATNYRMTNVQAGFLYDQLCDLDHILTLKQNVMSRYHQAFQDIPQIQLLQTEPHTEIANWMYVIMFSDNYEEFEKYMNSQNIDTRPLFYDIGKHPHLTDIAKHSPDALDIQGAMLPSYPGLTEEQQNHVIQSVIFFFSKDGPASGTTISSEKL